MDVKEAISKRRSIRKYQDKEVPLDLIQELIDAARQAPSADNAQPWRYYLVRDKETREKLKENHIFGQDFVYQAPVMIVCCCDLKSYRQRIEGRSEENENRALRNISIASAFLVLRAWVGHLLLGWMKKDGSHGIRDVSIASAFLVLRATELGLATCYVGWMKKDRIKDILDIPREYIVPFVIAVGYANEQPRSLSRKNLDQVLLYAGAQQK